MPIEVEIVTPRRQLFSGSVDMVTLPGVEGQMGIMRNHAPLLTILDVGEVTLHHIGGRQEYIAVTGGVVEVRPNKVIILARAAERAEEIDLARAQDALQRAQESVRNRPPGERKPIEAALQRSRVRLKVAARRRRSGGPAGQSMGDAE